MVFYNKSLDEVFALVSSIIIKIRVSNSEYR